METVFIRSILLFIRHIVLISITCNASKSIWVDVLTFKHGIFVSIFWCVYSVMKQGVYEDFKILRNIYDCTRNLETRYVVVYGCTCPIKNALAVKRIIDILYMQKQYRCTSFNKTVDMLHAVKELVLRLIVLRHDIVI